MKGVVIAIATALAILLLAVVVRRDDSPSNSEPVPPPRSIAANVGTTVESMEERGDVPGMPSQAMGSDESERLFGAPMVVVPSAEMRAIESTKSARDSAPEATDAAKSSTLINSNVTSDEQLTLDQTADIDISLRNGDFPRTYISTIRVDLESPNHWVRLTWAGPDADSQETGPFHSSPGRGLGNNDCDDVGESNRDGSNCTPKGTMQVEGFSASMPSYSHCRHVTWFLIARGVAFHYYPSVPDYPASHGCVRLGAHAAQLIHNNSKIGETEVVVEGKWEFVQ